MLKFSAKPFVDALRLLSGWESTYNALIGLSELYENGRSKIGDGEIETHKESFGEMKKICNEISLKMSEKALERGLDRICTGKTSRDVSEALRSALEIIPDEIDTELFFYLTPVEADFYNGADSQLKGEAASKFSDSKYELSEAAKCFAMNRYSACVMHAMRALEPGLAMVATEVGEPFDCANWNTLLSRIEKKLRASTDITRERREFISGAVAQFFHFKDAWRNRAMHGRDKYSECDARPIMQSVVAFLQHLGGVS